MSINIETIGTIPYNLAPTDQFQVTIDITTWLDGDTIDSVTFTATDEDGEDATDDVLVTGSCSYTDTQIRAYIKGGTDGTVYTVKCAVVTAASDKKSFYIKWVCDE
jgi:hypothetical protein